MRRIFENKKIVGIYNDYFDYLKITFLILLIIGLVLSFFFSPSDPRCFHYAVTIPTKLQIGKIIIAIFRLSPVYRHNTYRSMRMTYVSGKLILVLR